MAGVALNAEGKTVLTKPKVLVTGHAGYIGAVMVPMLVAEGFEPVGLDTHFFDATGLSELGARIPEICKDVRDVTVDELKRFDAVIHLAALSNDPMGDLKPELTLEINYRASVRLARLAREAGVRRFLFSSSCSIYGASGNWPLDENARVAPLTAYAESKVRTEDEVSQLADSDFSPVFLRNATAYGASPRLRADVVLNNLTCWAVATGKIRIISDGTPWRPLVHIEDISRAFIAALYAPREAIHNQAFNVGSNEQNYQVRDIAEVVKQVVTGASVEYGEHAGPDARNYRVDFGKIARVIPSFRPLWNARSGAQQVYDSLAETGLRVEDFQGRRFTRLAQLRFLIESGRIDSALRWTVADAFAPAAK
jgi:nucleoside-diphosphate-sugar epimerase